MVYSVQYAITPESFPADVRTAGVGICSGFNRLGSAIAPIVSSSLIENSGGIQGPSLFFGLFCLLGGVAAMFVRETRGRNPDFYLDLL